MNLACKHARRSGIAANSTPPQTHVQSGLAVLHPRSQCVERPAMLGRKHGVTQRPGVLFATVPSLPSSRAGVSSASVAPVSAHAVTRRPSSVVPSRSIAGVTLRCTLPAGRMPDCMRSECVSPDHHASAMQCVNQGHRQDATRGLRASARTPYLPVERYGLTLPSEVSSRTVEPFSQLNSCLCGSRFCGVSSDD